MRAAANPGKEGKLLPGQGRPRRLACSRLTITFLLLPLLPAGCIHTRDSVEKNLMANRHGPDRPEAVNQHYQLACPDVLDVSVAGPDGFTGPCPVGPDGRIALGDLGRVRVEGRTSPEAARAIAQHLGRPADAVQVQVAEHKSQLVFLFGQVAGWQRAVPYQGQETVLDLLQRVGGITPGAEPEDIYVVRSHVADGQRPEVFHIDLKAIVLAKDQRTNLRLYPYDQIYVGDTRQSRVEKCFPRWLRPLYHAVWGTRPSDPDDLGPVRERRRGRVADVSPPVGSPGPTF